MERKRTLNRSDFFARFKMDGFSWRDRDLAPGSGVSPHAGFAGLDAENAEPSEFDPLPVVHGRFQNLKNGSTASSAFTFGIPIFIKTRVTMSRLITRWLLYIQSTFCSEFLGPPRDE